MTASRLLTIRIATALAGALACSPGAGAETPVDPPAVAAETPAFVAPLEPSEVPGGPVEGYEPLPEPEGVLVLQDALAVALMNSPELAMFSWEVRAAEARSLQAGKWINPELDLRFYRLGIPRAGRESDERRTRIILSQVFELGRKPHKRTVLADVESDLARWDYEAKRVEVATEVAVRFVALLGEQRRAASLARHVQFLEQAEKDVATMVESGALRSLEIHEARRQLGMARIELRQAEAALSAARFRMAAVWGGESPLFTEAAGDLEELQLLPDIGTVIELAERSPSVARWEAELARGQAALSLAKARRVPDLRAGAGVRWEETVDETDYILDFEIDLPFFDRKQGEIREARSTMARAEAGRKAAEAASSEGIADYYYLVEAAQARSEMLAAEVLPAARSSFEAHRTGFERNAVSLRQYLRARRDLAEAEIEQSEALVEYHQSLAILEGIVGHSLAPPD
jgi:cobalt-zinc-cadmium efflux system outer membrane protein